MPRNHWLAGFHASLQFRVAAALAIFVAVVVSAVLFALFTVNDHLENQLLNTLVAHELGELVEDYPTEGAAAIPHSANLSGYVVPAGETYRLPAPLRGLAPHESGVTLDIGDRTYQVGTRPVGRWRAYVAYDITAIESRETLLATIMIAAALIVLALAVPLGAAIARISLKPINALADHVGALAPDEHDSPLAERYPYYEVGIIARAFDRFMDRLDAFVERERAFTADASHELRTPLAVVQGAVEVLQQDERLAGNAPLERIDRASQQMAELIEALLFLARDEPLAADGSNPACRADEVVADMLEAYRPLTAERQLEVGPLTPCTTAAPRIALVIVFGNLLRNALRHGGNEIRISLDEGRLTVADNGQGMAADQLRRVFDRGYCAGPGDGAGLGMYLVANVADRYGWPIGLTSRPGEGTRIELQLE